MPAASSQAFHALASVSRRRAFPCRRKGLRAPDSGTLVLLGGVRKTLHIGVVERAIAALRGLAYVGAAVREIRAEQTGPGRESQDEHGIQSNALCAKSNKSNKRRPHDSP
jgi:hypothetical protein